MSIGARTKGKIPLGNGWDGYTWNVSTAPLGTAFTVQAFCNDFYTNNAILSVNGVALSTTYGYYSVIIGYDEGDQPIYQDDDYYCQATVPASPYTDVAGNIMVMHVVDATTKKISNPKTITVGSCGITSISPNTATRYDGATTFTLTGLGFTAGTVVNVNAVAQTTTYISPTQVSFTSPAGYTAGDMLAAGTDLSVTATTSGYTCPPVTVTVSAWDLTTPSGFTAWWDPNTGVTNTGSPSRMSTWTQATSGSIQFSQSTAGNRPQQESGTPGWVYAEDSAPRYMFETTASSNFITTSAGTVIIVLKPSSITKNSGTLTSNHKAIGTEGQWAIYFRNNGPTAYAYNNDGSEDVAAVSCPAAGTAAVYMWRHGSGNIELSVNNGTPASTASGDTSSLTTGFHIFGQNAADHYLGRAGAFALYNVALSAADVTRAVNLLRVRYSI